MSQTIDSNSRVEATENGSGGWHPEIPKQDEETSCSQAMLEPEHEERSQNAEDEDETNPTEPAYASPQISSGPPSSCAAGESSPTIRFPEFLSPDILRTAPLVEAPMDYWLRDHVRQTLSPDRIRHAAYFRVLNAAGDSRPRRSFRPQIFKLDGCEKPWQLLVAEDLDFEKFKAVMEERRGFHPGLHSFYYVLDYTSPAAEVVMVVSDRATWIHGIRNQRGRGKREIKFYFDLTANVMELRQKADGAVATKATENQPEIPLDEDLFGTESCEESKTGPRAKEEEPGQEGAEGNLDSHWTWNS